MEPHKPERSQGSSKKLNPPESPVRSRKHTEPGSPDRPVKATSARRKILSVPSESVNPFTELKNTIKEISGKDTTHRSTEYDRQLNNLVDKSNKESNLNDKLILKLAVLYLTGTHCEIVESNKKPTIVYNRVSHGRQSLLDIFKIYREASPDQHKSLKVTLVTCIEEDIKANISGLLGDSVFALTLMEKLLYPIVILDRKFWETIEALIEVEESYAKPIVPGARPDALSAVEGLKGISYYYTKVSDKMEQAMRIGGQSIDTNLHVRNDLDLYSTLWTHFLKTACTLGDDPVEAVGDEKKAVIKRVHDLLLQETASPFYESLGVSIAANILYIVCHQSPDPMGDAFLSYRKDE